MHLKSLNGKGKFELERKEALDRARADSAWHRRERQMLPESNAGIGDRTSRDGYENLALIRASLKR